MAYPTDKKSWAHSVGALHGVSFESSDLHSQDSPQDSPQTAILAPLASSQDGSSRPSLGKLLSRGQFERPDELLPEGFQFPANNLSAPRRAKQPQNGPRDMPPSDGIPVSGNTGGKADDPPCLTPSVSTHPQMAQPRSPESRSAPTTASINDEVANTREPADDQHLHINYFEATQESKQSNHHTSHFQDGSELTNPVSSRRHQDPVGKPRNDHILAEPDPLEYFQNDDYSRIPFPPEGVTGRGQPGQSGSQSPLTTTPAPVPRERVNNDSKRNFDSVSKRVPNLEETIQSTSENQTTNFRRPDPEQRKVADALPDLTFKSPAPGRRRRRGSRILTTENSTGGLSEPGGNEPSSRPYSRDSNISKRRATMLTPRQCASTPDGLLTKGRTGLAQAWNSYFEDENRYRKHIQAENNRLQGTIDEYVKTVRVLQHERAALLTANENLEKGLDRSNHKLDETTEKVGTMATKVQEYRKRLNDATEEQQRLYTKSKKMIQDAREEFDKSTKSREAIVQAELDKSESARKELHKKVTVAVAEAREKINFLDGTNRSLKAQLQERQRDLEHEREVAKHLQQELEGSHHTSAEVLNTLKYQNAKILTGIEEQHCLYQDSRMTSYELEQKLDSITSSLEEVQSKLQGPDTILQQLGSVRGDIMEHFTGEIRNLSSVTEFAKDKEQHNHQVEEIKTLCQTIKEHVENNQEVLRWQTKYEEANNKLRATENQTQHSQAKLKEAMESSNEIRGSNNELKKQVTSLNAQLEGLRDQLRQTKQAEASEISGLKQLVSEKNNSLRELNVRLEESSEQLRIKGVALEEAESDRQRLTMTLHSVNKRSGMEDTEKMRLIKSRQDYERRLGDSEQARIKIERDLQKAKVRIQHLSTAHSSDDLPKLMRDNLNRTEDLIRLYVSVQQDIDVLKQTSDGSMSGTEVCRLQEACRLLERDSAAIKDVISSFSKQEESLDMTQDSSPPESNRRDGEPPAIDNARESVPLSLEEEQRGHRVTLKSPTDELAAAPLTALQERIRRRTMQPLKPSIKASNRFTAEPEISVPEANKLSTPDPAIVRGTQKNLVLSVHNQFNRPVTGNAAPADRNSGGPKRPGLKRSQSHSDTAADDDDQNKRQRRLSPPQSQEEGGTRSLPTRQKLGRSLAPFSGGAEGKDDSEFDKEDVQKPTTAAVSLSQQLRGGPLRRQPSGLKTYGSQDA